MLKGLKEKVQKKLEKGDITEEKANQLNAKLDDHLKEIKEFKKLSLEEKKSKLLNNLQTRMNEKVKEDKISREKADEIIKKYSNELKDWDGESYPKFMRKYFMRRNH
ncbi:MAG: hypothetical protein ACOC4G_09985 [Bacillota bacterium]